MSRNPELPDPFLYLAAVRYAIRRYLTSASEFVADDVARHAEHIRSDPGAAGAIRREIEDLLADQPPETHEALSSRAEWEANRRRWADVADKLKPRDAVS